MTKFSLEKTINADRDFVFEIFSNYENYQKIFPQHFPSIRIRSVRENVAVVEEHVNLGEKELIIMAKHVTEKPVLHEVFVIGGDAKGSVLRQKFVKLEEGTKVIVDVNFKLKGKFKISRLFGRNNLQEDYTKILDDFIKTAEN